MILKNNRQKNGYREVVNHLESLIVSGAMPPGSKLPSLRELCDDFNISIGTAGRGLRALMDKGMVDVRRGAGSYVADRRFDSLDSFSLEKSKAVRIAAFIGSDELLESYCSHALRGAQDRAVTNDCSVYLNQMPVFTRPSTKVLDEMSKLCDVVLLLGEYDLQLKELPGGRPYVGVEMHGHYGGVCSTVSLDPAAAAELACRFFLEQGCSKVKAVTIPHLLIHRHRAMHFLEQWKNYGEADTVVYRDPTSQDEITMMDISDPDCGYWFSSGTICQRLALPYRMHTGRYLAQDRKVVAVDGKSLLVKNYEPMNTIGIDWYDAGVAAFEECLRRVDHPGSPARRIYLDCKFSGFESKMFSR